MQPCLRPLQRLLSGSAIRLSPRAFPSRTQFSTAASSRHLQARPGLRFPRPTPFSPFFARHNSELTAPASSNPNPSAPNQAPRPDQPAYQLTFTCKPCKHRSAHRISKQGYHRGTVLIQCPSCKNRHVVSDHLKIFMDEASTLEDILQRHGSMIKKGKLGIRQGKVVGNEGEEDIEFWDDGSETNHKGAEN
jgi:protein import protein ZIM17